MKRVFALLILTLSRYLSVAQTCENFAVELTASTQVSPPRITLAWKRLPDTTTYTIYRKAKTDFSWHYRVTLSNTDSTYTDTTVVVDSAYEYQVIGYHYYDTTSWTATGYIYAGIKCPAMHSKGVLLLIVDSTFIDTCSVPLQTYMKDLSGDGWQVIRHDVSRSLKDTGVRSFIIDAYNHIANVKAVQLIGHVAVPYSGDINPDGHTDHKGAWPADVYYSMPGWGFTDDFVSDALSSYPANRNIPYDGKWDVNSISANPQLQLGRVDFYNMPAFGVSENQLMKRYLARDHKYKMDSLNIRHRALINDNFGVFSQYYSGHWYYEAFASCGWRSFPPLLGKDSISTVPFISSLNAGSYQWAYGCGGGGFRSSGGIGSTDSFAANNVNGIFTMMFGSYYGDWNVQDNFLRAPLCAPVPALTSCWAGRPYWFFHQMALGENIGYCTALSQCNDGNLYGPASSYGLQQMVHMALMGDLSLRTDYIKPASGLSITTTSAHGAVLNWSASPDGSVAGYYVYRSDSNEFGNYQRLNDHFITTTSFHDSAGFSGLKYYMVRPVKLQTTPSGAYYNLGIGITDSATVNYPMAIFVHGQDTICAGTYNTLTALTSGTATPHYQWKKNGANVGVDSFAYVTNALANGDIIQCLLSGSSSGTTIATSDSFRMVVRPQPVAGVIAGGTSVCIGTSIALTDTVAGGSWSTGNPSVASVNSAGSVSGIAVGSAVISYTVTNSCGTISATRTITVITAPVAGAITVNDTVCTAITSALSTVGGTSGGNWLNTNGTVASISASGSLTGLARGSDTIIYVVSNMCGSDTSTRAIMVEQLPDPGTITGTTVVCELSRIVLTDTTTGGIWSARNTHSSVHADTVIGISAGIDTILYTKTNFCGSVAATYLVTVNPLPVSGTIYGSADLCPGTHIYLGTTSTGGSWSAICGHTSVSGGGMVSGATVGVDTIRYTVTNSCGTSVASHEVTVNPHPVAGTITGPSYVCVGSSITLSDTLYGGTWTLTNSHATNFAYTISGISAGLDTVMYSITNYCGTATTTKAIHIYNLVTPSVGITSDRGDTLCGGDTITFTPVPVNGGTTPAYYWKRFSTVLGSGATFRYVPANGDVIGCVMVSDAVCPSPDTVSSSFAALVVNPAVTITDHIQTTAGDSIRYPGQDVTFNSEITYCGSSATHQWYLNSQPVPGATGLTFSTTVYTNDTVFCINYCNTPCATNLIDTSNTIIIYADYLATLQLHQPGDQGNISIYPNPNKGSFDVYAPLPFAANEELHFDVMDITGKVFFTGATLPGLDKKLAHVSLSGIAPGHYILRMITGTGVLFAHFIVQE